MGRAIALSLVMVTCGLGCSAPNRAPSPPLESIAITDVSSMAGEWQGLLVQSPPSRTRHSDWVRLYVEQDGSYRFEAFRTIGVFTGYGTFTIENGRLVAVSPKGRIVAELHQYAGTNDRLLKAEGRTDDGITYKAELTPTRQRR